MGIGRYKEGGGGIRKGMNVLNKYINNIRSNIPCHFRKEIIRQIKRISAIYLGKKNKNYDFK